MDNMEIEKRQHMVNYLKVGIKLLVVLAILVLSYINAKKSELKKSIWLTLIGLTVLNILIATVG